jgi:hypothetical protein
VLKPSRPGYSIRKRPLWFMSSTGSERKMRIIRANLRISYFVSILCRSIKFSQLKRERRSLNTGRLSTGDVRVVLRRSEARLREKVFIRTRHEFHHAQNTPGADGLTLWGMAQGYSPLISGDAGRSFGVQRPYLRALVPYPGA